MHFTGAKSSSYILLALRPLARLDTSELTFIRGLCALKAIYMTIPGHLGS